MPPDRFDPLLEIFLQIAEDLLKAGRYIFGVVVGVSAKLAVMHRIKNLTWKDVMINSVIALAAAYFMYNVLIYYGYEKMATPISVICGRYSDDVLNLALKWFKKVLKMTADDMNKKQ